MRHCTKSHRNRSNDLYSFHIFSLSFLRSCFSFVLVFLLFCPCICTFVNEIVIFRFWQLSFSISLTKIARLYTFLRLRALSFISSRWQADVLELLRCECVGMRRPTRESVTDLCDWLQTTPTVAIQRQFYTPHGLGA